MGEAPKKVAEIFFMPSINLPVLPMAAGRWLAPEVIVSSCSLLGPRPGGKPGILRLFFLKNAAR